MTLEEYISSLQKFVKENPETAKLLVVYSEDDEGNGFAPVHFYNPTKGIFDGDYGFIPHDEIDEVNDYEGSELSVTDINAVCIN